ncbi:MAG: GNAT family N-acetyltransferase [Phormidesmis sp.]
MSAAQVYKMLAVRQQVFVLEQKCLYLDADGLDNTAWHLFGYPLSNSSSDEPMAYARLLPPHTRYKEPSIGRVLVQKAARGTGLGRELITQCLEKCQMEYWNQAIRISAQVYLTAFYESFGFETFGEPYDDGGIAHIGMLLNCQSSRKSF